MQEFAQKTLFFMYFVRQKRCFLLIELIKKTLHSQKSTKTICRITGNQKSGSMTLRVR